MESLLSATTTDANLSSALNAASLGNAQAMANQAALQTLTSSGEQTDTVDIGFGDLYKSLTVSGQKIIDSLNELLKDKLPNGLQSLKPDDVTPEKTAENIVSGATASFSQYLKQHSDEDPEKVLERYMKLVRKGVEQGYGDACKTLKGLGAFDYDGVQAGVEQTKQLIDTKLDEFEKTARKQLGLDEADTETVQAVTAPVKAGLLTQGGGSLLQVTA